MKETASQIQAEKDNRRKSSILTTILAILFIVLAFIPFFNSFKVEEPGIAVIHGLPDMSASGPETAPATSSSEAETEENTAETPPEPEPPKASTPPPAAAEPTPSQPKKAKTADNDNISLKEEQKKKKAEAEAKKKADAKAKAEKKEKAEAEAKRKAEEAKRKKALEDRKSELGDLFNSGGDGEDSTPTGQEDGTPDGEVPVGVSSGMGEIGGGLSGRKVLRKPTIKDNSQATGKVIVKVCVGKDGKVISSDYTQAGSTTTDNGLIQKAVEGVKGYKFEKGQLDKQCGTISVTFKVR